MKVKTEMVLNRVLGNMVKTMKDGDKISLLGFGTFIVVKRVQREVVIHKLVRIS